MGLVPPVGSGSKGHWMVHEIQLSHVKLSCIELIVLFFCCSLGYTNYALMFESEKKFNYDMVLALTG
jgi:hypothetical protein